MYWDYVCEAESHNLPIDEEAKTTREKIFSSPKHPFRNPEAPPWTPIAKKELHHV